MKKHLSVLLAFVMIFTMIPLSFVFADDYLVGTEKAKLELVYMEYNAGVSEGENGDGEWSLLGANSSALNCTPSQIPSYDDIEVGQQILVGVKMSGLNNMKCVDNGEKFHSISTVIEYDPTYLTAESSANLRELTRRRAGYNNELYKSVDGYRYTVDSAGTSTMSDNVKVTIKYSEDGVVPTYPNEANYSDEQYVAIVGFTVKAKPDKATGAQVVALRGGKVSGDSMAFGATGNGTKYTAGASSNSMDDVFEYDSSAADIFPVMYTLTFDDNVPEGITVDEGTSVASDTQSVQHDLSIKEYSTITGTDPAINNGKVPTAVGQGKGVSGWATDPEGNNPFTVDTPVTADTTLYAQWSDTCEITFNPTTRGSFNDTTDPVKVEIAKGGTLTADDIPAASRITAPTGYNFFKWNTQENGGGTDVVPGYVVNDAQTVYAIYQAATPGPDPENPDVNPTPNTDAITVTFDQNGGTDAKPTTVYVATGGALNDVGGLPNEPKRENYEFAGWFDTPIETEDQTQALGATILSTDFKDSISEDNELTLFAHWNVTNEADRATVTFLNNYDKVATSAGILGTVQVYKGDTVNIAPTVMRDGFTFTRWNANGAELKLNETQINANTDVYAIWSTSLYIEFFPGSLKQDFDGTDKAPTISAIKANDANGEVITPYVTEGKDYTIIYIGSEGVTTPRKVDTYAINVDKSSADRGVNDDIITAVKASADEFEIAGIPLTIALSSNSPKQIAKTDGIKNVELEFEVVDTDKGFTPSADPKDDFDVKYYTWDDTKGSTPGAVELIELDTTGVPSALGNYLVTVKMINTNYRVGGLKDIDTYTLSADSDSIKNKLGFDDIGNNIKLELVKAVSLDGLTVQTSGAAVTNAGILYTDPALGDANKTDFNKEISEYYTQVPDGEKLQFVMTGTIPEEEVTVTLGGVKLSVPDITITTVAAVGGGDEVVMTVTINKDLDPVDGTPEKAFANEIIIAVGDETYTFDVGQLIKANIELSAGNSPYGEIMKDSSITDKAAAKAAFDESNSYNGKNYSIKAWVDVKELSSITEEERTALADPNINMDKNETAIFIYNGSTFVDPGFTATDSNGKIVTNITRKITVKRALETGVAGYRDVNVTDSAIVIENQDANYVIGEITNTSDVARYIRPDVYDMEYSFVDSYANTTVSAIRKVVVLDLLGDTDPNGIIAMNDRNFIAAFSLNDGVVTGFMPNDDINEKAYRVFVYRVADTDPNSVIAMNDRNAIAQASLNDTFVNPLYNSLSPVE